MIMKHLVPLCALLAMAVQPGLTAAQNRLPKKAVPQKLKDTEVKQVNPKLAVKSNRATRVFAKEAGSPITGYTAQVKPKRVFKTGDLAKTARTQQEDDYDPCDGGPVNDGLCPMTLPDGSHLDCRTASTNDDTPS